MREYNRLLYETKQKENQKKSLLEQVQSDRNKYLDCEDSVYHKN